LQIQWVIRPFSRAVCYPAPVDPVETMLPSLQGVRVGGEPLFADVRRHERIAVGRDHLRVTRVAVPAIIEARRVRS